MRQGDRAAGLGVTEVARHDILGDRNWTACGIETGYQGIFVADWYKALNAGCKICRRPLQRHQRGSMARRVLFSEGDSQFWGFGTTDGLDRL